MTAKALDTYIGELSANDWKSVEAETQFQGNGLSHEHSALLLTEVIQYTLHEAKQPLFTLFLDAKSAFDKALFQILSRRLYLDGTKNQNLSFIIKRLENRITFCEWDKELMGPIIDEIGLEQGGKNSTELWKVYNNEQLNVPQQTDFGVDIADVHVASIGQADDCVLLSTDLHKLKFLLHLTLQYCEKYQVELSPGKTKLQLYTPPNSSIDKEYLLSTSSLQIDGIPIEIVEDAEHVGVIRSTNGNLPHLLQRFTSHNRALHSVLHVGLSRGQRGNPAASIRVESMYGVPVLLSGTAPLVLKQNEFDSLDAHHKAKIQNLFKLYDKTPDAVIYFLSGSLPASAILHLKQLTLFSMITRLPENILNKIAKYLLTTSKDSSKSWFFHIKSLTKQYQLPHPLTLLENPLSKYAFKKLIKSKICDFWEQKLRLSSSSLKSLRYFNPNFMSLQQTHPIFISCGENSFEVSKAIVQAKFLSGRYRSDTLLFHFGKNSTPKCALCKEDSEGSIEHLLVLCQTLKECRLSQFKMLNEVSNISDLSKNIILDTYKKSVHDFVQLLLDPSTMPQLILNKQKSGENTTLFEVLKFSRTWCFNIHVNRMKILGRWIKSY